VRVKKRALTAYILAGVLALGGAAAGAPYAMEYVSPTPATFEAVVKVMAPPGGLGTGVVLPGGVVLTAAHVVKDAKSLSITPPSGKIHKAEVLWASAEYDLALLKTDADLPAANLTCDAAKIGDTVRAVGTPLGNEFISSYGHIAGAPRAVGTVKSVYMVDLTIVMGNSGGPLFNDAGEVVGIASMVMIAPLGNRNAPTPSLVGFGFAVPSSVVCKLLGRTA
jgi:S1-C subfamily serine protease